MRCENRRSSFRCATLTLLACEWWCRPARGFLSHTVPCPYVGCRFDAFPIEDGLFITVLEYCGGTDLDQLLKQQGSLAEKDAKRVLVQVRPRRRHRTSYLRLCRIALCHGAGSLRSRLSQRLPAS